MSKITVTQEQITSILENSQIKVMSINDKTTIVICTLPNGFVFVESSSCVDPANYNEEIGHEICINRIANKLWELEGYMLQEYEYRKGNLN